MSLKWALSRFPHANRAAIIALCLCLVLTSPRKLQAQLPSLLLQVEDVQRRPVRGLEIGIEGPGGSALTGDDGKALVALPKGVTEAGWVSLEIIRSPKGKELDIISPWDYRAQITGDARSFVRIVVVEKGDRMALATGSVLRSLAARINQANAPKDTPDSRRPQPDPKVAIESVARQYGIAPHDLDAARQNRKCPLRHLDRPGHSA